MVINTQGVQEESDMSYMLQDTMRMLSYKMFPFIHNSNQEPYDLYAHVRC
jgi:hypothetical protein